MYFWCPIWQNVIFIGFCMDFIETNSDFAMIDRCLPVQPEGSRRGVCVMSAETLFWGSLLAFRLTEFPRTVSNSLEKTRSLIENLKSSKILQNPSDFPWISWISRLRLRILQWFQSVSLVFRTKSEAPIRFRPSRTQESTRKTFGSRQESIPRCPEPTRTVFQPFSAIFGPYFS